MKVTASLIAYTVASALILVGLLYFLHNWGDDGDKPSATPTVKKIKYMSSDGIIENIERRLTEHEGRQMKARCPKRVAMTVGNKFTCKVYFADRKGVIANARVKIDGPRGEFSWKSEPKVKSTPKP
jgi:hypothetical protein